MKPVRNARRAYGLLRSDSGVETLMGVFLLGIVVLPFVLTWLQMRRGGDL
jgi:hypothetical protein